MHPYTLTPNLKPQGSCPGPLGQRPPPKPAAESWRLGLGPVRAPLKEPLSIRVPLGTLRVPFGVPLKEPLQEP